MSGKEDYVKYFRMVWNQNKARGLKAQVYFEEEMHKGRLKKHADKLFDGCWLISPKSFESHKSRFCVFVHDRLLKMSESEVEPKAILGDRWRQFYAVAEHMNNAGFGVIYAVPHTDDGKFDFDSILKKDYDGIHWDLLFYKNEKLAKMDGDEFFAKWNGRGRPTYRKDSWQNDDVAKEILSLPEEKLQSMMLQEVFYTGYLKTIQKKGVADPYDVDSFLISYSQKHILPIEMKEKFPVLKKQERYFGIDAGRILMLLRICIANDSNALYIVREVDDGNRKIKSWKYITLSKIIMSAGWNLQSGGKGMVGGGTQTVKIPYDEFLDIGEETFEEDNLKKISNLPKDVKDLVVSYKQYLDENFGREK